MTATPAQIEANRKNALLSTGPKTPEGKARSRANSLKHGLCSTVCVPEDPQAIQDRIAAFFGPLKPQNQFHVWLVDHVAVYSLRIDRCERMDRRARDKVALRAELTWDDDRKLDAEILGGQLARRPAEVAEKLKRTPHGCDWLIIRWALLAHAAEANNGDWSVDQINLAFDLQGVPLGFREGRKPGSAIDSEGREIAPTDDRASLARRQIAELQERKAIVAGLDEVERALAAVDLNLDSDPEIRRIRRYESTLHSRFRWFIGQIQHQSPHQYAFPGLVPDWSNGTKPDPKTPEEIAAENHNPDSPHPPFDLEPDEAPPPGEKADIPAVLKSRKQKRISKAENRREAKRRKIENLRA
jgi:hypothetical protein